MCLSRLQKDCHQCQCNQQSKCVSQIHPQVLHNSSIYNLIYSINTAIMKPTLRERWRKACTADNIVDFSVDVFLIVFDVLSSPILIVMRIVRWILAKFINEHVKNFIKRIVHWFLDNRKIRLERGQNIFRYYWYLWMLSPFIIFGLWMLIAVAIGFKQGTGL